MSAWQQPELNREYYYYCHCCYLCCRRHHHHYYHYHYHYHCLAPGLLAIIFSVDTFRMPLSVRTQSPLKARASWILRRASEQTAHSIWFHVLDKPYPTHIRIKQGYLAWSVVYEYLSSYWLTEVHHWPILAIVVRYPNTMQTWDPSRAGFLSTSARWCISKKKNEKRQGYRKFAHPRFQSPEILVFIPFRFCKLWYRC